MHICDSQHAAVVQWTPLTLSTTQPLHKPEPVPCPGDYKEGCIKKLIQHKTVPKQ